MDYYIQMRSIIAFVENRIYENSIDYKELEEAVGFSIAHIRDIFIKRAGIPLMRYVEMRKIVNSCFNLLYSQDKIIDIAFQYGFESHETYSRAFKRVVGISPIQFRKERPLVGKDELITGVYGLTLLRRKDEEVKIMSILNNEASNGKEKYVDNESTILYGVPKVGYGIYGCTPFPICLKACVNYLGEDIDYDFAMVSSAAAFRMTWDRTSWNLGNVDINNTFDKYNVVYGIGAKALGRSFEFLERTDKTKKEEFINFIKRNIDKGLPCMALGIIGPPEACIITGYKDKGNTLIGWNFFQTSPDCAGNISFDKCGYFISDTWWENTDTQAVMCMGEVISDKISIKDIVNNAIIVLNGRENDIYSKGINAYDAWKKAILDENEFGSNNNLSLIYEKLMCQDDAVSCLTDGRGNAAKFFAKEAEKSTENKEIMNEIAKNFNNVYEIVYSMTKLIGAWDRSEEQVYSFSKLEIRKEIAQLIDQAKDNDKKALELLKKLYQDL